MLALILAAGTFTVCTIEKVNNNIKTSVVRATADASVYEESPTATTEKAKESERVILACGEYGFAETKNLPYGKCYSAVEVQAPYGYVLDITPMYFDITAESTEDR